MDDRMLYTDPPREEDATPKPKYPDVRVKLTGTDGNAFAVLGRVTSALRRAAVPKEDRDAFMAEATSGDYDNLLCTCCRWVTVR